MRQYTADDYVRAFLDLPLEEQLPLIKEAGEEAGEIYPTAVKVMPRAGYVRVTSNTSDGMPDRLTLDEWKEWLTDEAYWLYERGWLEELLDGTYDDSDDEYIPEDEYIREVRRSEDGNG